MMTDAAVTVFARLVAGRSLNGELDALPGRLRPLGDRMNALPAGERGPLWDAFLAGRDDRDALIEMVARAPLDGPLPGGAAPDDADAWPPPCLGEMPPVGSFPVDVFPEPVADFARAVAASIGCPVDFVGLPMLIVAGAAIGRSASLMLKPGYFAPAALYGMNVGGPSSGKSPALEAVARPLWTIDEALHDLYRVRKVAHDEAEDAYRKANGAGLPRPVKPTIESAVLDDATVEAVARHLALNPRGLLVARDEGSAWVASLNQYKGGKGSDRQFWLSALFGKQVRVDRKGNPDSEPIRIPHPFLAVAGNIPPDMLGELADERGRADGLIERLLFAYPDPTPRPHWSEDGIPEAVASEWAGIVGRLRERPMDATDGKPHPHVVYFTDAARAAWVAWYNAHVDETNDPGFDARELAVDGKLCDFAARLALILHLLDLDADPTRPAALAPGPVSPEAVRGAVRLWHYFRSHHRRARWHIDGGIGNPDARSILAWARRTGRESFPLSDLTKNFRRFRDRPDVLDTALAWLAERHAIRPRPEADRPSRTPGRKPGPSYDLHPDLSPAPCAGKSN